MWGAYDYGSRRFFVGAAREGQGNCQAGQSSASNTFQEPPRGNRVPRVASEKPRVGNRVPPIDLEKPSKGNRVPRFASEEVRRGNRALRVASEKVRRGNRRNISKARRRQRRSVTRTRCDVDVLAIVTSQQSQNMSLETASAAFGITGDALAQARWKANGSGHRGILGLTQAAAILPRGFALLDARGRSGPEKSFDDRDRQWWHLLHRIVTRIG